MAERLIDRQTHRTTDRRIDRWTDGPADRLTDTAGPASQPTIGLTDLPTHGPTNRPSNPRTNQPTFQPTDRPTHRLIDRLWTKTPKKRTKHNLAPLLSPPGYQSLGHPDPDRLSFHLWSLHLSGQGAGLPGDQVLVQEVQEVT